MPFQLLKPIISIKNKDKDDEIEVEVLPEIDDKDPRYRVLNQQLSDIKCELKTVDANIKKYECEADALDYGIAAGCGVISGLLDAFFVGKFDLDTTFITGETLEKVASSNNIGINKSSNLFSSITDQYTNTNNSILKGTTPLSKFSCGLVNWNLGLLNAVIKNPTSTLGVPSPIASTIKDLAKTPLFQTSDSVNGFSLWLRDIFDGKIFKDASGNRVGIDYYIGNSIFAQVGKLMIPVVANEVFIRIYYFIRRLTMILKERKITSFKELTKCIKKSLPFKNRTIARMLSVSTTTMTAIDLADACVEGLINSSGSEGSFFKEFALRINYVGVCRTVIAISSDISMGIKLNNNRNKRLQLINDYTNLNNQKLFYKQGDMWTQAMSTEKAINDSREEMIKTHGILFDALKNDRDDLRSIGNNVDKVNKKNPGLINEIKDILEWE